MARCKRARPAAIDAAGSPDEPKRARAVPTRHPNSNPMTQRPSKTARPGPLRPRPIVAIIGRPNVGKSTLFNRLVGRRKAIVEDIPGVTRDRNYAPARHRGRDFTLVDTGGLDPSARGAIGSQVSAQSLRAVEEADLIVVVFDGREGLTPLDREVAEPLRRIKKPVFYAANKIDTPRSEPLAAEFYQLGVDQVYPISSEGGMGVDELLDALLERFPAADPETEAPPEDLPKIAVVGRPNAGKSTLINRLLGEERLITDATPGTTRDTIDTLVEQDGRRYLFIDTAGIRRRGRIERGVERYSLARALEAIQRADVALMLLDASEGIVEQDTKIVGLALKAKKGCVILLNKWDVIEGDAKAKDRRRLELSRRLGFIPYAPVRLISALRGDQVKEIFGLVNEVYSAYTRRITTGELNRVFEAAVTANPPPQTGGRRVKLYYITQAATRPPTFVLFVNRPDDVKPPYLRYLENVLRERFEFGGSPLVLRLRARR